MLIKYSCVVTKHITMNIWEGLKLVQIKTGIILRQACSLRPKIQRNRTEREEDSVV